MTYFPRVVSSQRFTAEMMLLNTLSALDLNKCFTVKVEVPYEQDLVISSAGEARWTVTSSYSRFPKTKVDNGEKQLVLTDREGEDGIYVQKKAYGILWLMDVFKLKYVPLAFVHACFITDAYDLSVICWISTRLYVSGWAKSRARTTKRSRIVSIKA